MRSVLDRLNYRKCSLTSSSTYMTHLDHFPPSEVNISLVQICVQYQSGQMT